MKRRLLHASLFMVTIITFLFAGGTSMLLGIGTKAPDFSLVSSNGDTIHLSDFSGKNDVVLVFYPGDQTPGCTKQLCAIRDDYSKFTEKNIKIFGVNPADKESHRRFIEKQKYQFPLLVDPNQKTAKLYGAGGMMINRTVYAIDKKGMIVFAKRGMPSNDEIIKSIPEDKLP
jgi:thioredoxin-dependent peroxiredoxin